MTSGEAQHMLYERVSSRVAIEILEAIDSSIVEIYGVEGFCLGPDGQYESKLDLMFDLSVMQNLFLEERASFIRQFVERRAADDVFFEVYGDQC